MEFVNFIENKSMAEEVVSHDRNIVINSGAMFLCHAFCNPNNVSILLFLQLQKRVKYSEAELSHESVDVHFDLLLEKTIFNSFVARITSNVFK